MTTDPELERLRDEATSLLANAADARSPERLLELVYGELRRLAQRFLGHEREDHTLQATALVHEAYARLVGGTDVAWNDHRHFFSTAARAMRRILVDHARARGREKRGAGWERVPLDAETPTADEGESVDVVALHRALEALAERSPRQAEIVELRYFAGLEVEAVAKILEVSERTVVRDWRFARAWLLDHLSER